MINTFKMIRNKIMKRRIILNLLFKLKNWNINNKKKRKKKLIILRIANNILKTSKLFKTHKQIPSLKKMI